MFDIHATLNGTTWDIGEDLQDNATRAEAEESAQIWLDRLTAAERNSATVEIVEIADTNIYFVLSGEGENGTWQTVETTERGIKQLLTQERCNGHRWATAYTDIYEMADGGYAAHDIETGEVRQVPQRNTNQRNKR